MSRKLSLDEVKQFAMKNYGKGGDIIVECWTDKDIQDWIERDGSRKGLEYLLGCWQEEYRAATCDSGFDPEAERELATTYLPNEDAEYLKEDDFSEDRYTSATAGDYSPGCPWNAPGMSISDFI